MFSINGVEEHCKKMRVAEHNAYQVKNAFREVFNCLLNSGLRIKLLHDCTSKRKKKTTKKIKNQAGWYKRENS